MSKKVKALKNDLIISTNPKSAFAEAIKAAKTNILFSSVNQDTKVISITSPEPGDGKSFITANLALAFAEEDKKVLLIDGDLRRGRQHHIFNLVSSPSVGYSTLILGYNKTGKKSKNDILNTSIRPTSFPNLDLLPLGPTPPNPLELLSSENNRLLLNRLRKKYDMIIIDCPPILGLSDALVLGKLCDANFITVSSAKTKFDQLEFAKNAYEKINSHLDGVIINRAKVQHSAYSSYYSANKYYASETKKDD